MINIIRGFSFIWISLYYEPNYIVIKSISTAVNA